MQHTDSLTPSYMPNTKHACIYHDAWVDKGTATVSIPHTHTHTHGTAFSSNHTP